MPYFCTWTFHATKYSSDKISVHHVFLLPWRFGRLTSFLSASLSTQDDKISMSPPFIMSLSVAPNGIVAAGTADGKLWLGFGGEKTPSTSKSKKKAKWGGLDLDLASIVSVAEAPIVAVWVHSGVHAQSHPDADYTLVQRFSQPYAIDRFDAQRCNYALQLDLRQ